MQNKKIPLLLIATLVCGMTACQPPSADTDSTTSTDNTESSDTTSLTEAKTPRAMTSAIVELSEYSLREKLICSKLDDAISAVGNKSEIKDVTTVQHQISACLPAADNSQILQWLTDYQSMYDRFLQTTSSTDNAAFYTLMRTIERDESITVAQLKQVSPRVRYLVGLIRGKADISVRYLGGGDYEFHHNLIAMAELFSPYLPDDQSEFIERMAHDNQEIFWFDAAIAFAFEELVERTLFWEDFMKRHPHSIFYDDASDLFDTYRYLLFFGSDNTQWTDEEVRSFYNSNNERLMQRLSIRPNSQLAKDVQTFLDFMEQPDAERHKQYPTPDTDEQGHKINESNAAHYQLSKALAIPSPWASASDGTSRTTSDKNKVCMSGIVCVDKNTTTQTSQATAPQTTAQNINQ
ncbi:hypothetical protein [Psychrobacter sp.]|uniref:hypothetical protein n=1 Tax=Psychrobacter sp. TaxID=56811 RepID=UPI003F987656